MAARFSSMIGEYVSLPPGIDMAPLILKPPPQLFVCTFTGSEKFVSTPAEFFPFICIAYTVPQFKFWKVYEVLVVQFEVVLAVVFSTYHCDPMPDHDTVICIEESALAVIEVGMVARVVIGPVVDGVGLADGPVANTWNQY